MTLCQRRQGRAVRARAVMALGAALALLAGGPAGAAEQGLRVETAEFVVSIDDNEGNERSIVSTLVPFLPNRACFGWRIRLADAPPLVRLREVLRLPEAPAFWSGEGDPYSPHVFSADRTTATTEEFQAPHDGWIGNRWCIAEGDPVGAHSIDVFVDGALVQHFDFEVKRTRQDTGN